MTGSAVKSHDSVDMVCVGLWKGVDLTRYDACLTKVIKVPFR